MQTGSSRRGFSYKGNTSSRPQNKFNNFRNRPKRRFSKPSINPSKYVSQAVGTIEVPAYQPKHEFADFALHAVLKKNVLDRGYQSPTQIQDQTIPEALLGKDILGLAATGSGKTAAFLLPTMTKVMNDRTRNEKVLIIAPTRELAQQIDAEFRKFAGGTGLQIVTVTGGASMDRQSHLIKKRPQFVVATPGRLKDLHNRELINLRNFTNVVLDEVDRMLDMGFLPDIKLIVSQLPEHKQSLFFSATMSSETEKIAHTLLRNPIRVQVTKQDPSANVEQSVRKIARGENKVEVLHDLLISEGVNKTLVFTRTKFGADRLAKALHVRGFKVDAIHGNKTQSRRNRAISDFREEKTTVLVATDVAARGLDIRDISHVINYDEPATFEDYIHRIGRTGRAGKKGIAVTFIDA